jgi:hypothetical protein
MARRAKGACNAQMKDDLERQLSIMVCAGDLTLKGAQHEIASDWRAAYKGVENHRPDRRIQMYLKLERVDAYYGRTTFDQYGVFDELIGKRVGTVSIDRYGGRRRLTRTVQLFDEKYRGTFETPAECVAFVKIAKAERRAKAKEIEDRKKPAAPPVPSQPPGRRLR